MSVSLFTSTFFAHNSVINASTTMKLNFNLERLAP